MLKLIIQNIKKTNDVIILAVPLLFFITICWIYINKLFPNSENIVEILTYVTSILTIISGFCSIWLYMLKKILDLSKIKYISSADRLKKVYQILLKSYNGVGKYFVYVVGAVFSYILIYSIANYILELFNINNNTYIVAMTVLTIVLSYFTIFWLPEIVYAKNNGYKALLKSTQKVILNPFRTFVLYLFLIIVSLIMYFCLLLWKFNPFLYILGLTVFYYLLVYCIVLIFSYYERFYIYGNQ